MSSIVRAGVTFHGISVFGRGVFTNDEYEDCSYTYAGQYRDGYACGLGVTRKSDGTKTYAEYGRDGQCNGRWLVRDAIRNTHYRLYERGEQKEYVIVHADGRYCLYNGVFCAPDDPRLLRGALRNPSPPPAVASPLAPKQSSDG
jgi:hypothetical protein